MADAHIGFLYKAASTLSQAEPTRTHSILRSYYLMRCMHITKGYGLPDKHFSSKSRCPHCCVEWNKNSEIKLKPLKLSKRQKRRIKLRKPAKSDLDPKTLLHSNELEIICSFCKHRTVSPILKPTKEPNADTTKDKPSEVDISKPSYGKKKKPHTEKKTETSIYYNAKEVFSLKNKNNALNSAKEAKVIRNCKKKKDKFAGLCQQAVLTTAKLREAKNKNKLLSFLKTSS